MLEKIRVMHIITRLILGGAQENTLLTVEGLQRRDRYDACLVTGPALGPEGELLSRARRNGVNVKLVDCMRRAINPWRDAATYRALCRMIRDYAPHIVHTHSSKAGIIGRLAAKSRGVPAIIHTIHGLPFHPYENAMKNRLYVFLERRAARASDAIITVADAMTRQALAAGVGESAQFQTIYSGLEISKYTPLNAQERDRFRDGLGIPRDAAVICKVARLFHLKGHEFLLRAMKRIVEAVPSARLVLVGDGILKGRLEETAGEMGIRDRVIFAGLVAPDEIRGYVGMSDVVAHCSLREGLARVLPQSMLCGVPVVSYDIDGAREAVIDGETGFLVPPESVDELADAIIRLLTDRALAARMADAGRRRCLEMFDGEKMVNQIAALYERILHGKGIL
jgi:glycosyltransferase involved in cell wall biosynthesis